MSERLQPNEGRSCGEVTARRELNLQGIEIITLDLSKVDISNRAVLSGNAGLYEVNGLGSLLISASMVSATIGCEGCPELQGARKKMVRRIDIGNGWGEQMISHTKVLRVDIGWRRPKGSGRMRPEIRRNTSLGGPYGSESWRRVWV